jgi:hypothetical protein
LKIGYPVKGFEPWSWKFGGSTALNLQARTIPKELLLRQIPTGALSQNIFLI